MLLLPAWHSATLGSPARLLVPGRAAMKNSTLQKLPALAINVAAASPLSGQMFKLILLFWGLGTLFVAVELLGGVGRVGWVFPRSPPGGSGGWGPNGPGGC